MTDLTEKWKNGELEDGRYYFRHNDNSTPFAWFGSKKVYDGYSNDEIVEVLAPVPSYEEWQKLKEENRALAMGSFPMMLEAAKKIDKLKELLKECREELNSYDIYTDYNEVGRAKLLTKIDEVLK